MEGFTTDSLSGEPKMSLGKASGTDLSLLASDLRSMLPGQGQLPDLTLPQPLQIGPSPISIEVFPAPIVTSATEMTVGVSSVCTGGE